MITRKNEAKTLVKLISCVCKCRFDSVKWNVIKMKIGIMLNVNVSVKSIAQAKRIIVGIPTHVFVNIVST